MKLDLNVVHSKPDMFANFKSYLYLLYIGQFILYHLTMSAKAAYEEWLNSQKFKEDFQDFNTPEQIPELINQQSMIYIGLAIVLVLLRLSIGLFNWFSKYLYFKAKRQQTFVHSLYYTFLYQSGSGKIFVK